MKPARCQMNRKTIKLKSTILQLHISAFSEIYPAIPCDWQKIKRQTTFSYFFLVQSGMCGLSVNHGNIFLSGTDKRQWPFWTPHLKL